MTFLVTQKQLWSQKVQNIMCAYQTIKNINLCHFYPSFLSLVGAKYRYSIIYNHMLKITYIYKNWWTLNEIIITTTKIIYIYNKHKEIDLFSRWIYFGKVFIIILEMSRKKNREEKN